MSKSLKFISVLSLFFFNSLFYSKANSDSNVLLTLTPFTLSYPDSSFPYNDLYSQFIAWYTSGYNSKSCKISANYLINSSLYNLTIPCPTWTNPLVLNLSLNLVKNIKNISISYSVKGYLREPSQNFSCSWLVKSDPPNTYTTTPTSCQIIYY